MSYKNDLYQEIERQRKVIEQAAKILVEEHVQEFPHHPKSGLGVHLLCPKCQAIRRAEVDTREAVTEYNRKALKEAYDRGLIISSTEACDELPTAEEMRTWHDGANPGERHNETPYDSK